MEIKKISELPVSNTLDNTAIVVEDSLVGKQFDGGKIARRDDSNNFTSPNVFGGATPTGHDAGDLLTVNGSTVGSSIVQRSIVNQSLGGSPYYKFRAGRGTLASPGQTLSGDVLGGILGTGTVNTGAQGNDSWGIIANASQDHTTSAQGTTVTLSVTKTGATSRTSAFKIDSNADLNSLNYFRAGPEDANHPKIRIRKISGTTAGTEGGTTSVALGTTKDKVVGIFVYISLASGDYITVGYDNDAEYKANWYIRTSGTDNIVVVNSATSSVNILSRPFTVLVMHTE